MPRPEVIIRMAKNDDGDVIERLMELVVAFQWDNWKIDWHDIEPNWLAAEINGEVVGVIQVVPAKPIGRIECLVINPTLPLLTRTRVMRSLTNYGISVVRMHGAQAVSSMIPRRYSDYLAQGLSEDWIELDDGAMLAKRLV